MMNSSDHTIPFEKKVFEEVIFLLKYHQNHASPQESEHKKEERKIIEKRERKKEEKKVQESLQIKGKSLF
jgi:hypothetical protein